MDIVNSTILITGGTSGIGLAFAKAFVKAGNKVIITGRREDKLNEISSHTPGIITKVSDVSDAVQRLALADWIKQSHPDINVLLNNAGVQLVTDLKQIDLNKVQSEVETNFIGPVHLTSLLLPLLSNKPTAAIINITSGLAFAPLAPMAIYCATKAAMHSLTLSLRFQLKETAIKVFEIVPPSVDTELGQERRQDKSQTHGGVPVEKFVSEALTAIKNDKYEAAIDTAAGLHEKREKVFEEMNVHFQQTQH